jgi:hypothetical protein
MKRHLPFALAIAILFLAAIIFATGCASSDPFDNLVADVTNRSHHTPALDRYHFPNGLWDVLFLPASATPAQLIAELPRGDGSFSLDTTNFYILETRHIRVAYSEQDVEELDPNYTAVLVKTDSGRKIVLAQFQRNGTNDTWAARVYDVNKLK